MAKDKFWQKYVLPTQEDFFDVETINPAEAYRKQAEAINLSGPLYAKIETAEAQLGRIIRVEKEIRSRILLQSWPVPGSIRTNELLNAYILENAENFITPDGYIRDAREFLLKLERRKQVLEADIKKFWRRIEALDAMTDKCDRVLNWAKHQARMELNLGG